MLHIVIFLELCVVFTVSSFWVRPCTGISCFATQYTLYSTQYTLEPKTEDREYRNENPGLRISVMQFSNIFAKKLFHMREKQPHHCSTIRDALSLETPMEGSLNILIFSLETPYFRMRPYGGPQRESGGLR